MPEGSIAGPPSLPPPFLWKKKERRGSKPGWVGLDGSLGDSCRLRSSAKSRLTPEVGLFGVCSRGDGRSFSSPSPLPPRAPLRLGRQVSEGYNFISHCLPWRFPRPWYQRKAESFNLAALVALYQAHTPPSPYPTSIPNSTSTHQQLSLFIQRVAVFPCFSSAMELAVKGLPA